MIIVGAMAVSPVLSRPIMTIVQVTASAKLLAKAYIGFVRTDLSDPIRAAAEKPRLT